MTISKKSILMIVLSAVLMLCTAMGIFLSTPLTAKAEETPDYLRWDRVEVKAGDILAYRYVLIDGTKMGNGSIIIFDKEGSGRDSSYGRLHFTDGKLKGRTASGEEYIEMSCVLSQSPYFVYYIMPYVLSDDSNVVKPLTQSSELSNSVTGMYFLNDNGATTPDVPDEPEQPSTTTLPTFEGVNYNTLYLNAGDVLDNDDYLCVFDINDMEEAGLINLSNNYAIHIKNADNIEYKGEKIEPIATTTRYGSLAYVYNISSIPEGLTVNSFAGNIEQAIYMLTLKDGAESEVPTQPSNPSNPSNPGDGGNTEDPTNPSNPSNPSNPGDGGNTEDPTNPSNPSNPSNPGDGGNTEDPTNPPSEGPKDETPQWIKDVDEWFKNNTGIVLGSSGVIILSVVVLFFLLRR